MTTTDSMISQVLERVQQAGAEGDLIIDEGRSLALKARQGTLEEQAVSETRIMGLRVIQDQRVGIAFSEATDETALSWLVEQALLNARFNQVEAHERIPDLQTELASDDALLCPHSTMSTEARIELLLSLEQQLSRLEGIRNVPYNGLSERLSSRQVASTSGLRARSRQRMNFLYAYALAARGDITAMAGWGQAARLGEQLQAEPIIERSHQEAMALLEGKPVASGHYDVCFDPDAQKDLFSAFSLALSGKAACDGINPWRERIGEPVAVSGLTLLDRPLHTDGFGYALFDAEGTACAETPIVVGGRLQTLLHNTATAHELGAVSTGHAVRGPRSALGVGSHQIMIEPGEASSSELERGEYLLLTQLQGTHSGANALSGDFSFGASGYLCRDGEKVQSVRGITVAGNFYQMLQRISAIGDTAYWDWSRSTRMPTLRFADVAISG